MSHLRKHAALPTIRQSVGGVRRPAVHLAAAAAASAALVIVAVLTWQMLWKPHSHGKRFDDFGSFLKEFERDPTESLNILAAKYQGLPASEDDAAAALRRSTVGRATILGDHRLFKRYVLNMPCCRCVQTAYQRNGEVSLVLFEHDEPQLEWFGHRPAIQALCRDKSCCLIQLGEKLAGSWPLETGHITVVGMRDVAELEALVRSLQQE